MDSILQNGCTKQAYIFNLFNHGEKAMHDIVTGVCTHFSFIYVKNFGYKINTESASQNALKLTP